MLRRGKSRSCELRVRSWYHSYPNHVNEKAWALLWQQVTLERLHAVLQFGSCGCECCCWWNGLTDTDLLSQRRRCSAQLGKHQSIWSPSHTKRRWVIPVQTNGLQWNSFVPWLKTLGPLRSFPVWSLHCGEIVEHISLWYVYTGGSNHTKPWGDADGEEILQKGGAVWRKAACQPWANMAEQFQISAGAWGPVGSLTWSPPGTAPGPV